MVRLYLSTIHWALDSAIIRWPTSCEYSDVGFYDTVSNTYLSSQLSGGVRFRKTSETGMNKESYSKIMYLTAPGIEEAYSKAITQLNKPYDYTAIFGLAFNRDWRSTNAWYCSELVAWSFEPKNPLFNPSVHVWRIVPENILLPVSVQAINPVGLISR